MTSRPQKSRASLLATVTVGLYQDAARILEAVMQESKFVFAWRPVRAAALRVMADLEQPDRIWMTQEEFARWVKDQDTMARRRKLGEKPLESVGISPYIKMQILRGNRAISKVEALAMAHYAHYRPVPIPAGDSDAFSDWMASSFGAVEAVTSWLGLRADYMTDRMRGFDIVQGKRQERLPDVTLIRALDWVLTMGPFCPYGQPSAVDFFPKGDQP